MKSAFRTLALLTVFAVIASAVTAAAQSTMTKDQKIAQAMAAGPASISANATIVDWPDKSGKQEVLRKGTNDWVCMPSEAQTQYLKNDALCIDKPWQAFFGDLLAGKKKPSIKSVGYGYMLTSDADESNISMMEAAPTKTNQWHHVGPHVMIAYPSAKTARALSSDPHNGGPYVMWKDSPFAHVMVPVPK